VEIFNYRYTYTAIGSRVDAFHPRHNVRRRRPLQFSRFPKSDVATTHVEAEASPVEDPQVDWFKNSSALDALHALKIRTANTEIRFGGAGGGIPNTRWTRKVRTSPVSEGGSLSCDLVSCDQYRPSRNLKRAGIANHAVLPLFPRSLPFHPSNLDKMTVIETVKSAVGLSETSGKIPRPLAYIQKH
jgi:hypothetical protein